jgi:hypothetical protein
MLSLRAMVLRPGDKTRLLDYGDGALNFLLRCVAHVLSPHAGVLLEDGLAALRRIQFLAVELGEHPARGRVGSNAFDRADFLEARPAKYEATGGLGRSGFCESHAKTIP